MGYFKATATQVGKDQWRVAYDIDPEAIELAESVADIGPQLGAVASGDAKMITLSSKPGLFMRIVVGVKERAGRLVGRLGRWKGTQGNGEVFFGEVGQNSKRITASAGHRQMRCVIGCAALVSETAVEMMLWIAVNEG